MGRTGTAAYESLISRNQRVVSMDAEPTVLEKLLAHGRRVVYADIAGSELWGKLPFQKITGIILTLPSFENRINAISQLREQGYNGQIGTVCYQIEDENRLKSHGASFVIHPLVEAGNQLATQMLDEKKLSKQPAVKTGGFE